MTVDERIRQIIAEAGLGEEYARIFSGNVTVEGDRFKANWFHGSRPMRRITVWRMSRYLRRCAKREGLS